MLDKLVKKLIGGDEFGGLHNPEAIIVKGQDLDHKYGYMYGNYYEKEERKKAAKMTGSYMNGNGGGSAAWSRSFDNMYTTESKAICDIDAKWNNKPS
ncbi:hypothetical protein FBEOM_6765 [Fusarium beomiforme]|uniref:Uncharacterized protein n=1 Tax=Fusarium beomiforme TaxID=44412 RepID=A0A9P5AII7_9HYPO|nr:hypothetical protein FBEOM_6765 [Fusarium beomiforme]